MNVAILVPYKNRERYLQVLLERLPRYLQEENRIEEYVIYVSEQTSGDVFNLALSRNVAALSAIQDNPDLKYFVFHDVDMIPLQGVDYGPRDYNLAWFVSAGSCKILVADFLKANGYDPSYVGWGGEDTDFYHRVCIMGGKLREWHRIDESKGAVIQSLEMPNLSLFESTRLSRSYWGHSGEGPQFVPYLGPDGNAIERYDKWRDFFLPDFKRKNDQLCESVRHAPRPVKLEYIKNNGINRVAIEHVNAHRNLDRIVRLSYRTDEVLLLQGGPPMPILPELKDAR
jgi:hypothetical protein